jgi:hypothetical protein
MRTLHLGKLTVIFFGALVGHNKSNFLHGKNSIMLGIKTMIWKIKSYSEKKEVLPLKNTLLYKTLFMKVTAFQICL